MGMGCTRVMERVAASVGLLDVAPTRFEASYDVSNGGVLCSLPALLANGLLRHTAQYFRLPKGFYGLIHVFLLLAFMALARVKNVEKMKKYAPGEWGNLLGLDRGPETRTLRIKIEHLSQKDQVKQWGALLSNEWMQSDPKAAGTLYVDGNVRVYNGSQTKLPRRYVSRQKLCLRGTTDYWVNDQQGRPFFVISTPFTSGLLDMLENEIVPQLREDVPDQPDESELAADRYLHRFVMVFDREGYSPKFFKKMWQQRIACQTYHKYPKGTWQETEFAEYTVEMSYGHQVKMKLAERGILLSNKLWAREIRKLTKTGHQTSVLSMDYKAEKSVIAAHMFSRWSQENFFKYMMNHFNIHGLIDYHTETADETKEVVNPQYRKLESQVKSKAAKLSRKKAKFHDLSSKEGLIARDMVAYEEQKGELKEEIDFLSVDIEKLKIKKKKTAKHILLGDLPKEDRFRQLSPVRKQFMDTIKMIAYRAETAMAIVLRGIVSKTDDARTLLQTLFSSEVDLIPNIGEETLTVKIHHFANPLSDRAIKSLCEHLNQTETIYPGTNMRMIFNLVSELNP